MSPEFLHQHEILLKKAVSDIEMARLAIERSDANIDDATVLFHLQQAAEKLLKSLMSFRGIHFEKIHDLTAIIASCTKAGIELPEYVSTFSQLNPFAVIGRYEIISSGEVDLKHWLKMLDTFRTHIEGRLCQ